MRYKYSVFTRKDLYFVSTMKNVGYYLDALRLSTGAVAASRNWRQGQLYAFVNFSPIKRHMHRTWDTCGSPMSHLKQISSSSGQQVDQRGNPRNDRGIFHAYNLNLYSLNLDEIEITNDRADSSKDDLKPARFCIWQYFTIWNTRLW